MYHNSCGQFLRAPLMPVKLPKSRELLLAMRSKLSYCRITGKPQVNSS